MAATRRKKRTLLDQAIDGINDQIKLLEHSRGILEAERLRLQMKRPAKKPKAGKPAALVIVDDRDLDSAKA